MEFTSERPPEYVSHNPDELRLPSVPQHEVGSPPHHASDITLPGLSSVLAGMPERHASSTIAYDNSSQSYALRADQLARLANQASVRGAEYGSHGEQQARSTAETAVMSPTETGSVMSFEGQSRRSTSAMLEDPDVRMAAEALSGLHNIGYQRQSTASRNTNRPSTSGSVSTSRPPQAEEPLLELLVEAHPWVGGTINGSLSAYTTTKGYTPRFVQYSAKILERNIGNTVSVVGRRTGVENGIRRYLGKWRPSDLERSDSRQEDRSRRGKATTNGGDMDVDVEDNASVVSDTRHEYLPAYRGSKPPSYREEVSPSDADRHQVVTANDRSWSTKLMISTSGLGVALSETSLKSLTFCVHLLTKATEHVQMVMNALKMVLRDYEKAQEERQREHARFTKDVEAGFISRSQAEHEQATRRLADRIQQLCDDIMNTLKTVVDSVSTYAGGALPENARRVVKGQLLSIPQRWRVASQTVEEQDEQSVNGHSAETSRSGSEDVTRKAGNRMIVFAQEGLDMMGQVNDVVKITLQSAEEWLNTLGRRQPGQSNGAGSEHRVVAGASREDDNMQLD